MSKYRFLLQIEVEAETYEHAVFSVQRNSVSACDLEGLIVDGEEQDTFTEPRIERFWKGE
jgi:hypothetical protein